MGNGRVRKDEPPRKCKHCIARDEIRHRRDRGFVGMGRSFYQTLEGDTDGCLRLILAVVQQAYEDLDIPKNESFLARRRVRHMNSAKAFFEEDRTEHDHSSLEWCLDQLEAHGRTDTTVEEVRKWLKRRKKSPTT